MSFKEVNGVTLKEIRAAVTLRRCQGSITVRTASVNNSGAVGHGPCLAYAVGNIAELVIITKVLGISKELKKSLHYTLFRKKTEDLQKLQ